MNTGIKHFAAKAIGILNRFRFMASHGIKDDGTYNPLPGKVIHDFNKTRMLGPQKWLCYAPFNMIYFAFNGEMIACCHNRKHIMGRYPEQSIEDIWGGAKYEILREHIRHNDLSYGCDVCKNALIAGNYDGAKNGLYDRYGSRSYPQIMEFELDNLCNLACVICNDNFSSGIKPLELKTQNPSPYDAEFVKQITPYIPKLKEAKFYGGEPFLINLYYNIWEKMLEMNPKIEILIQTNGTVLNEKVIKLLERGRFNINISIDSLHKENFEKIRKNANFEETMENVAFFIDYCKQKGTHLGIIPTPNRLNWQDIPEITNWATSIGAKVYFNTLITPLELALWNLPQKDIETIYSQLSAKDIQTIGLAGKENARHYKDFLHQIQGWKVNKTITENAKTKISLFDLKQMKDKFILELSKTLHEKERDELMLLFEQTLSSFDENINHDLFFAVIRKVPIEIVVKEIQKRDLEHLKKNMGKKIYEGSVEYEIIRVN